MQLIVSPQVRDDLREAYRFVADNNPEAADRLLTRIIDVIGFLASASIRGRRAHLRDGREVETPFGAGAEAGVGVQAIGALEGDEPASPGVGKRQLGA